VGKPFPGVIPLDIIFYILNKAPNRAGI